MLDLLAKKWISQEIILEFSCLSVSIFDKADFSLNQLFLRNPVFKLEHV